MKRGTPHLPIKRSRGGAERSHVAPEILDRATAGTQKRGLDWSTAIAVVPSLLAVIVSATVAWFAQSSEVKAHSLALAEARRQIVEMQAAQHAAAIEAARLQGDYAAVVKGIDTRLSLMQAQLDRMEQRTQER